MVLITVMGKMYRYRCNGEDNLVMVVIMVTRMVSMMGTIMVMASVMVQEGSSCPAPCWWIWSPAPWTPSGPPSTDISSSRTTFAMVSAAQVTVWLRVRGMSDCVLVTDRLCVRVNDINWRRPKVTVIDWD